MVRRNGTYWPAWNANASRNAGGTTKEMHTASSAIFSIDATVNGWKAGMRSSNALEVFERFETFAAAKQRLTGRGAEFADGLGILGVTAGTGHRPAPGPRRHDAALGKLASTVGRDPI